MFWDHHWNTGWSGRTWLYALVCTGGLVGLALAARPAEVAWRLDPARLVRRAGGAGLLGAAALAASVAVPGLYFSVALTAVAFAAFLVFLPVIWMGLLSVALPRLRSQAASLVALTAAAGGVLGQQLLESVGSRFGARWALLVSAVIATGVAVGLRDAARAIGEELDLTIARIEDEERLRIAVSRGEHLPLLGCRGIDFAYGQLQVLFDVGFTIDDGEIVAMLGTNGAGKSTLLRVISGLGFPIRGSVHYRGSDITYVDAGRRVALGISQVPGGRAVFGPMSVLDNLRVFGFSHGRNQRAVEQGVDATFAAFPTLAERRHQHAMTLSGGEQQMLALGKAFILKPRLLLIDELSLGLAPKVVAELLEMVRRINAAGTAVVLVEQSVNVALSLVDHAYFMEKGEIRFDGAATELVERPDLLRSVFLEGAAGMSR
jgi:ABC-type branched-subunit amino acid transport system ATPase component